MKFNKKNSIFVSILFSFIFFVFFSNSYGMFPGFFKFNKDNKSDFLSDALAEIRLMEEREKKELTKRFPRKNILLGNYKVNARAGEYKGKKLFQLDVRSQMGKKGGGCASCGYQALKNGFVVSRALLGKLVPDFIKTFISEKQQEEDLPKNLDVTLGDYGIVEKYIAKSDSLWRKKIIEMREVERLNVLLNMLFIDNLYDIEKIKEIQNLKKTKVRDFYKGVLGKYSRIEAKKIVELHGDFLFSLDRLVSISRDVCNKKNQSDIKKYYIEKSKVKTKSDLISKLCQIEQIRRYINIEKLKRINMQYDDYMIQINKMKDLKKENGGLGAKDLKGDWLDSKEINVLVEVEKINNGMLKDIKNKINIIIYDDISLIGNRCFDSNFEKLYQAVDNTIKNPNHIVFFVIGTMGHSLKSLTGSSGHWFSLVRSNNQYYAMDSLNNRLRLNDKRVEKIIDTFETELSKKVKKTGPVLSLERYLDFVKKKK